MFKENIMDTTRIAILIVCLLTLVGCATGGAAIAMSTKCILLEPKGQEVRNEDAIYGELI